MYFDRFKSPDASKCKDSDNVFNFSYSVGKSDVPSLRLHKNQINTTTFKKVITKNCEMISIVLNFFFSVNIVIKDW